ncbi:MAG: ATP-binding cassette domain-containing protein [Gordonia sp. (in: high G+C Gram-positive bacteria)]
MLDGVDLVVGPGDRLAVIGDNASGKSTLLKTIAGIVPVDGGVRSIAVQGGIGFAEQHPEFAPGTTVAAAIGVLLGDIRVLECEIAATAAALAGNDDWLLLDRLGDLLDAFDARDGYAVDLRLAAGLQQLGLGEVDRERPVATLSGGERARLALAAVLASNSELLLLDEPTNDLDDAAVDWLEGRLAAHRGAFVVVTHDRELLDAISADIVVVEGGRLRRHGDGYAGYLRARATSRRVARERYEMWCDEVRRCAELVEANSFRLDQIPRKREKPGFGNGAFRARSRDHGSAGRIRMAKERLARLHEEPAARPPELLQFTPGFTAAEGASDLLSVRGLLIRAGDRVLVSGDNGAGKTTLLRAVAGEVRGDVVVATGARIAWLRQDLSAPTRRTTVSEFACATGRYIDDAEDRLCSLGLLDTASLRRRVCDLSVGQRRRLDLAIVVDAPSDVLLLDEPTNHLAPELVDELEAALDDYAGAVLIVTHDRRWRRRLDAAGVTQIELRSPHERPTPPRSARPRPVSPQ